MLIDKTFIELIDTGIAFKVLFFNFQPVYVPRVHFLRYVEGEHQGQIEYHFWNSNIFYSMDLTLL